MSSRTNSKKDRRGGGKYRNGHGGDYRKQTGADSPNWRDHLESSNSSHLPGVASPPVPDPKPGHDLSVAEKYTDYLQKEWNEVEQLLNQGEAVWLNCNPSSEAKSEPNTDDRESRLRETSQA